MLKLFISLFLTFSAVCSATSIDLSPNEKSLYSQNGEDGVLAKIFQLLSPSSRYCIELGADDGITMSNTYLLRLQGWSCLLLDRGHELPEQHLYKEFITAENINSLFEKYNAPLEFDLLSIDIHYNDFHIWNAIEAKYRPSVVVIEYNAIYQSEEDKVVKYHPFYSGDGTDYFGASIVALAHLGRSKGYSLVYVEESGCNLFFIRDDLLQERGLIFKDMNDVKQLYRPPAYTVPNNDKKQRAFLSSDNLIKQ